MPRHVSTRTVVWSLAAGAATMATAACSGQAEPSRLDAQAQGRDNVTDVIQAYSESLTAQDWDRFLPLFWTGATAAAIRRPDPDSEPLVVVSQVADRVADLAPILSAKPVFESTSLSPAVFFEESLAMVWSPSATTIGQAADPNEIRGVDAITLLLVGDEWRIISIAYQTDAVESPLQDGGARQSILTALGRYYADFSARNWTRFGTHFWTDAMISAVRLPAGEAEQRAVLHSPSEFVELFRGTLAREPIFEVRMGSAQVLVRGSLAQVWVEYRVRLGDANISEWSGINAFTMIRFRGRWRIVSLAYATEATGTYHF